MTDPDWTELQNVWRQGGLEQRVHRYRFEAWRTVLLEALFAVLSVGFGVVWSLRSGQRWVLVWTLTLVALFAIALSYAIWSRRDALWPSSAPPLDFLAQAELRCVRRLELLRFMAKFGVAEVIISLVLFWLASSLVTGLVAMALVVAAGAVGFRHARRERLDELEAIAKLRREFELDA
jgi:hypothetical protein